MTDEPDAELHDGEPARSRTAGRASIRRGGRGWHGRRGGSGGPPPWWPEDEPWPPPDRRGPWGRSRGPWTRGFGCLFGLVFILGLIGLVSIGLTVVATSGPSGALARVLGVLVLIGGVVGITATARTFRRSATTLDSLVAAAERVETGDYTARVRPPARAPRPVRDLVRGFNEMAARLEANEAQRRTLLADVGHELRTPLAVLQGNVEAIIDGVREPDAANLGAILDETHVLARLVDDLRTLTLSEAGSLALHREPTDLRVLVGDVLASFQPSASASGVVVSGSVADDVPLLDIDPVRIREVLVNLLVNGIRHTPAGGSVKVRAIVSERAAGEVEVTVRDTGGGIDPALLPHVFDRFAKGHDSRGSGLGLAIARGLVEAHGGSIAAESRIGRGSTFRFSLPVEPRGPHAVPV